MLKKLFILATILHVADAKAQKWVDTSFAIRDTLNLVYGQSVDFAGNNRTLALDVSFPTNDSLKKCGRPLLVIVHGGAFFAGDKSESSIQRIRRDFAKRGYVTASVNYRLGLFQTSSAVNCNISSFGVEWNCLNMADTAEWYRAYYRGVQDVKGAIRYLINNANQFKIDANNVFVCGESAGGFIAMGAAYIDDSTEVLNHLTQKLSDVSAPNSIYESKCIQNYGLDTSIASMRLSRPDLGNYQGNLNWPLSQAYKIRGVGNFYGAVFNNIFTVHNKNNPALYLFHQPNDLIVPFGRAQIFAGFAACATQFPFNCQYIVNRPLVYGSSGIKNTIDAMISNSEEAPVLNAQFSSNTANCAQQVADPNVSGHAYDNFALRTKQMAAFFADKIDSCHTNTLYRYKTDLRYTIFPNPYDKMGKLTVSGVFKTGDKITLYNGMGLKVYEATSNEDCLQVALELHEIDLSTAFYIVRIQNEEASVCFKWMVNFH